MRASARALLFLAALSLGATEGERPSIDDKDDQLASKASFAPDPASAEFAPDQFIVKRTDAAKTAGIHVHVDGCECQYEGVATGIEVFKIKDGESVSAKIAKAIALGEVEWAEPDYIVGIGGEEVNPFAGSVPNDPRWSDLWGLHNQAIPSADINVLEAWERTTGSSDIIVCVIDTGVDYPHEDLWATSYQPGGDRIKTLTQSPCRVLITRTRTWWATSGPTQGRSQATVWMTITTASSTMYTARTMSTMTAIPWMTTVGGATLNPKPKPLSPNPLTPSPEPQALRGHHSALLNPKHSTLSLQRTARTVRAPSALWATTGRA
mmetsp:Transcript_37302/g.117375  ORF Transcript_37302/g.117375 Transcript_37302/m.117375 type:complete len:322 (+) Transcript_37302:103-1068(+)